jgi:hypothetical protein
MSLEGSSASVGEEILIENGQIGGGVADTSSSTQEGGIGDMPFPLPDSLSQTGVLWGRILVSVIVIVASIVIYLSFVIFSTKQQIHYNLIEVNLKAFCQ